MGLFTTYPTTRPRDLAGTYDYIIVGGGTAACVLANRLSEDESVSVLVVERGDVKDGFISRVPLLSSHFASDGSRSRLWESTPQAHVNDRVFQMAAGCSLGGSSKINAMLYTRGLPGEYNSWSQAGRNKASDFHGVAGEWQNRSFQPYFWKNTPYIIEGATAMGIPYVDDLNSPLHSSFGCAKMHYSLDRWGRRSSAFSAFLPAQLVKERRRRLHICVRTLVLKIDIHETSSGVLKAGGVFLQSLGEKFPSRYIGVRREVILCAGALSSPQILMLSGVGPADHLARHGIPILKDLPGVGSHLQDHLGAAPQYRVPLRDSIIKLKLQPWITIIQLLMYIFFGVGMMLGNVLDVSIFMQSRLFDGKYNAVVNSEEDRDASLPENVPDVEVMAIVARDMSASVSERQPAQIDRRRGKSDVSYTSDASKSTRDGGLGFLAVNLRPTSLGTVRLFSSDPKEDPVIDPNYLSTDHDREVMRKSVRFPMQLKEKMAARGYPITDFRIPAGDSDEEVDEFVRQVCETTYNYSSTCRMAPEYDGPRPGGVVDDRLCVHGVQGLRVADASVFPHILSTHLAAPVVAVAQKCADMINENRAAEALNGRH
ncbi:GMC oxidoreductase [Fomitopsis serialis]|uniref:GMC oxidoreductase n=1 Tax=Fomitopsis serialis TaxID=139415 RepID=UPI0020084187|nr:GMC oxidoreductase [Neoantrodia serialis]KAH9928845.1 GMC oxidoreductase [Neoantrodia serialis]